MPEENQSQEPQAPQDPGQEPGQGETPQTWEDVLAGLPEPAQALFGEHIQGLRTALDSEREQRKEMSKQLQKTSQQLEKGSEVRQDLENLAAKLDEVERRAAFYEEAAAQGVSNPRLAYIAAMESELFDKRGQALWERLKDQFPELFRPHRAAPPANAGAGGQPAAGFDMDRAIRQAARRT